MAIKETGKERRERFQAMSSDERKALIREKMNAKGLQEGSGVPGTDLSSYEQDEIWDLIQITSCFPEIKTKQRTKKIKTLNERKSLIAWILIPIALSGGMVVYYQQYPLSETRRELSTGGMFAD